MPIPADEFESLEEEASHVDLSPETTQGRIYHFLLRNADAAYRQREIVEAVDVPAGSVGPTLSRLEEYGLVAHRGRFWRIEDTEAAVASALGLGTETADEVDGGFTDDEVSAWMETAVDQIPGADRDSVEPGR